MENLAEATIYGILTKFANLQFVKKAVIHISFHRTVVIMLARPTHFSHMHYVHVHPIMAMAKTYMGARAKPTPCTELFSIATYL